MNSSKIQLTRIKIVATLLAVFACFGLMEMGARVVYHFSDSLYTHSYVPDAFIKRITLDPYEEIAPGKGMHWRLKPGFGSQNETDIGAHLQAPTCNSIRVNASGFRGPELREKSGCCRILMLGDSVTFGTKSVTYPEVVSDIFRARDINVEVINGGVEGYSVRNHLAELERYNNMAPDIVTILVGWNDIFSERPLFGSWEQWFRVIWLVRRAIRTVEIPDNSGEVAAKQFFDKPRRPNANEALLEKMDQYRPAFLKGIAELTHSLSASGAQVVLMTLPGLYQDRETISEQSLSIGHLPRFTDNPYVLSKLTTQFNHLLLEFGNRQGIPIIDLALWSETAYVPRHIYFSDSVHPTGEGLRLIGEHIAMRLIQILELNPNE